ncbi:MAG: hypothetical protein MR588_06020 [Bacteroidales bacterium]|nr:hypothetical protein [Bacteroidales bacterium]
MASCPRLRPPQSFCRRAVLNCSSDDAAAIRKSGLEIKNHCTQKAVSGQKPAAIPKSGPEIRIRCSSKPVLEAGHSSSQQRRIESDAELVAATTTAGETILCCCKEN